MYDMYKVHLSSSSRTQAGSYDHAQGLALEALEIEKGLGERKHKMVQINMLLAIIWDQVIM